MFKNVALALISSAVVSLAGLQEKSSTPKTKVIGQDTVFVEHPHTAEFWKNKLQVLKPMYPGDVQLDSLANVLGKSTRCEAENKMDHLLDAQDLSVADASLQKVISKDGQTTEEILHVEFKDFVLTHKTIVSVTKTGAAKLPTTRTRWEYELEQTTERTILLPQ